MSGPASLDRRTGRLHGRQADAVGGIVEIGVGKIAAAVEHGDHHPRITERRVPGAVRTDLPACWDEASKSDRSD